MSESLKNNTFGIYPREPAALGFCEREQRVVRREAGPGACDREGLRAVEGLHLRAWVNIVYNDKMQRKDAP